MYERMSRPILAGLLALLLVFAGCNAISLGGETQTATLTPAAVPTDEPTPTPVRQLAPGLTGAGVTDPFTLAATHSSILNDTSYTFRENATVRYANGTIADRSVTRTQFAANENRFHIVQNGSDMAVRGLRGVSLWSNGERVFMARMSDNGTSYNVPRGSDSEPVSPRRFLSFGTNRERIASLFRSVETRVADSEQRNGTTRYRVESTTVTNRGAFENDWQNPRNVTLIADIDSQGLVREYRLTYAATLDGAPVRIERHVRYTDIGNTTVERPSWYDDAIERTTPQGT